MESWEKSCINSSSATHSSSRHVRRITSLIWKLVALDPQIISKQWNVVLLKNFESLLDNARTPNIEHQGQRQDIDL